jgi:dephospho-CoA kinase
VIEQLTNLLIEAGPWIVLLMTFIETAFFIGLLIPAEPTILIAAFLAERGYFSVWTVLAATFAGGLLGDQAGYLLGRFGGSKIVASEGRIARIWQRHEPRAARLFSKHTSLSVSLARFISFVRTLMPWFAGMTRMPYGRYLFYDFLGVAGWAASSVALGYLAGESWEAAAHVAGRWTVGIVGAIALLALIVAKRKRHRQRTRVAEPRLRVALTGNIASGKSAVVRVWRELGAQVIDADVLARRAVEPGSSGHAAVVQAFGDEVLAEDGTIDRTRLREIVFNDEGERRRLEAIVHPEVARLRRQDEQGLIAQGVSIIVNDIPLLYEVNLAGDYDVVVHVHAEDAVRLRRLVETRGLSEAAARAMMQAQMPTLEKKARANIVIDNNGTLAQLEEEARRAWREIEEWQKPSA